MRRTSRTTWLRRRLDLIPANKDQYGYLSEHKSFGETDQRAGYAEDLAATMLATILGADFDPDTGYDERKDVWKLSDKIGDAAARVRSSQVPLAW